MPHSGAIAPVLDPVRHVFRAVAVTVVPEAATLEPDAWRELEWTVETALARRPAPLRRQLVLFLRLIELAPLLRYGTSFTRLDAARRHRVLSGLKDARLLVLRRGVWGLRTLVFMGYYSREAAAAEIGYRAHPDGWSRRNGA